MTTTQRDDAQIAEERGIAREMRCYRVGIEAGDLTSGVATVVLPYDIKIATIECPVAAEISLAFKDSDAADAVPADSTNTTSSLKLPLAAEVREPIGQEDEFNTIFIRPSAADAGLVKIWVGSGEQNNLTEAGTESA